MNSLFVEKHLQVLKSCKDDYEWDGGAVKRFAKNLLASRVDLPPSFENHLTNLEILPDRVSKTQLNELISGDLDPVLKVVSILAWGGMHKGNCIKALKTYFSDWEVVINKMISGEFSRYEAYERFYTLRIQGKLIGMGPAYFTKLIFFLEQKHNGYIMDQWTGRSMNLLMATDENQIHLYPNPTRSRFYVHVKKNDVNIYKAFCENLEALAKEIGRHSSETEMLIFSKGKKGNEEYGDWRKYVIENG